MVEDNAKFPCGRRDACCSPVKDLMEDSPKVVLRNNHKDRACSGGNRRHTTHLGALRKSAHQHAEKQIRSAPGSSNLYGTRSSAVMFSSDSDLDNNDRFFVPNRRKRAVSGDYEGGAEQSDTEGN
ncbi:hypothetical protein L596_003991 [Steinernema carpocapsae]|uniref:Uncharacterized protein n=1 Tax=Steinernema carpocapsae TaxID=34508 RepID=A0A4U8UVX3_STECR|nr:hypothetical protein L596_003991 [Steinernema carpocapsae]